ncbi:ABC transporter permease [Dinghuibacter silviterrae]|uniref:ABC-2 family transporter n=1 Tax=Dinghuibacter silviterrae TaxID=1539049 RepID=A0A4R8DI33_9BACT|nr:ABC transporter permease [Dinghuibacter silviterrae]TDW96796.1 ABC-2 family transporter [Dinghuibacter silviterrae]
MQKILYIEWMKVRSYRAFWILAGLFVVCVFGLNYIAFAIHASVSEKTGKEVGQALLGGPFDYPDVWNTLCWMSGWLLFIPGLIVITIVTNEYTFRTHRQNIMDGWTRTQFITVKLLWVVVLSLLAVLSALLSVLLFGAFGGTSFTVAGMQSLVYLFVESLTYMLVALLMGTLIRRSGLAIGMFFLYLFVFKYVLSLTLNHYTGEFQLGDYMPVSISDTLLSFPFLKPALKGKLPSPPPVYVLLLGSAVYMALFYWIMLRRIKTADL